jgi:succinate--hydroxymethylglutarate CoA-transferase
MLSCMLAISTLQTSEYWGTGVIPSRLGSAHSRNAPYQAFQGGDGNWFIVAAGNDRLWGWVCEAIGRAELKNDPRFIDQKSRAGNQKELAKVLTSVFNTRPARVWLDVLDAANVPVSPVLNYAEVLAHPQVVSSEIVQPMPLPNGGETLTVGNPVKMSGYEFRVYQQPPLVGEHTEEIVREWSATSRKHAVQADDEA